MNLFSNPELIRNVRAHLRWGRLLSVTAICAVMSLVVGYSLAHSQSLASVPGEWGMRLLQIALGTQAIALLLGGSIACLNAVHREKEMNTFDFQRVTRLTPWELAIGKLFGAPALVYFAVICLMPAALAGAFVGGARPTMVAAAYVVLLLGSITMHALALVMSMLHQRGTNTAAVLLLIFVLMSGLPGMGQRWLFDLGALNPFVAVPMAEQKTWELSAFTADQSGMPGDNLSSPDIFFGARLHHLPVLLFVYITFAGWFLLAVTRNLKRDPTVYELYSPNQSLGFLLYFNLLMLGFFRWGNYLQDIGAGKSSFGAQSLFLGFNLALFPVLGLTLLRNRDQIRRRLRELGDAASGWLAAIWPAPYLLAGMLLVGLATIGMIQWKHNSKSEWDVALAVFRLAIVALWVARDLLYLQWMNLTRARRPLTMGFVYLVVFYTCTPVLFLTLDLYTSSRGKAIASIFAPTAALDLSVKDWNTAQPWWWLALFSQIGVAALFAWLHRQKLVELAPAPAAELPLPAVGSSQISI